jgi:hypothetical protein
LVLPSQISLVASKCAPAGASRRGRNSVDRRADHAAVARRRSVELICHHHAAGGRQVLHDDGGIARNMRADVARHRARKQVIAAARRGSDHDPQLPAAVERRHVIRAAGRCDP